MSDQYFLPVIHPAFELLKRSSRMLHFIGASLIFINGFYLLQEREAAKLLCYLQLVIAVEIYMVLFFARALLATAPLLNMFFRLIEGITLTGAGFTMLSFNHLFPGSIYLFTATGFYILLYREWRMMRSESIHIRQTGIILPNFFIDKEISWPDIRFITPKYHSIVIETFSSKRIQFQLRSNLKLEELRQIDEFCRQHLAAKP